jgi:hypothetical protein
MSAKIPKKTSSRLDSSPNPPKPTPQEIVT